MALPSIIQGQSREGAKVINDLFIDFFDFLNGFLVHFGIDQKLTQVSNFIDSSMSYFDTILNWIQKIFYFIPKEHFATLFGIVFVVLAIRFILALYDQVAQVIP